MSGLKQRILSDENLLFLVDEFQRVSQLLLSEDAALLREAAGSTLKNPAVAVVRNGFFPESCCDSVASVCNFDELVLCQ